MVFIILNYCKYIFIKKKLCSLGSYANNEYLKNKIIMTVILILNLYYKTCNWKGDQYKL